LRFSHSTFIIQNFFKWGYLVGKYGRGGKKLSQAKRRLILTFIFGFYLFLTTSSESAEVIVIGDTQLSPVVNIITGIREQLDSPVKIYAPADIKGKLHDIAARENSKVVIALGREAIRDALLLPPSYAVIYDLVVTPPSITRPNTTGSYMATPVKEYANITRRYLPSLKRLAVIGSPALIKTLEGTEDPHVELFRVKSPFELVETLRRFDSADAVLLLPDVTLLTSSVMEEIYLFSFRRGIPILGISEKNVRQGSLLALVFDPVSVGRHLAENANNAIKGMDVGKIPPSPPQKFELYLNMDTARKMGISISAELIKKAAKIYP
jgi:putative ABC transport system substrate-binding protein